MVRVRANESVRVAVAKRIAMAKRINTQNKGGETSNPPTQREIGGGETLNPLSQREIGGEETPKPLSPREIVGGETPNPRSPRGSESLETKTKMKRRKTLNPPPPPPQKETGRGETSNPSSQREIEGGETSNPLSQRENWGGETSNSASSREMGGEETSNSSPSREETGGGRETVTIDTDLLDCSICTNPLCPPLYQCISGHVACYSCWSKVQYKCPSCNKPIGPQNIALEKVLESIRLPCPNANYGCHKSVSYSQMQVHTETCEFGPSLCPIPGCAHKTFSGDWREHFMFDHRFHCENYIYGRSCTLIFDEVDPYYTLFGPGKDLFLLVKVPIPNVGNALSIYYIDLPDRG